jgi:RNA polymerase sigma-70 factor (ECF subfamily)
MRAAPDERSYGERVEPYRAELRAHCYRMLGSAQDAEDALQETLLRAWRALPKFEERSSLRSWLYAIATNVCLRAIERRPAVEPVSIDPYPDEQVGDGLAGPDAVYEQRESVELAFIAALQHLPARQRAVLVLRDVLGFSAREAADALDATPASIDSALQRAHRTVDARLPERSQQATLRTLGDEALRRIVDRFVAAWERADVDAVVAMLADGATLSMPPVPTRVQGREAIAAFLARGPLAGGSRWWLVPTRANGQPAFGAYRWDAERNAFAAGEIIVITLDGDRIAEITAFLSAEPFERFGLPATMDSGAAGDLHVHEHPESTRHRRR